ncbi:hypothetical protein [Pseudonocardia ailaonensis]|uniref:hypothetical protein n=1 Tax=Pseudonocardia ailaonensis TaxID=367279 RepID=UPI0031D1685F
MVALAATAPMASAAPGSVSPSAAEQKRNIDESLKVIISSNPGATRVDSNTVELANGVVVNMAFDEQKAAARKAGNTAKTLAGPGCSYGYLCIWDDPGYRLSFYYCGFVNIGSQYGWSDRLREIENNQTSGTWSYFYNWTGSAWSFVFSDKAYDYTGYISSGSSLSAARTTDAITVC